MKMLWNGIKSVVSMKQANFDVISFLKEADGSKISDPLQIANNFNKYFTSVASDITKRIPRTPKSPLAYLSNPNIESFFVSPCTSNEISLVIQALKNGKSSGANSIPIKLLKILEPHISVDVAILINQSFETYIFPDKLKIAKVIPVFKKGLTLKKF